MKVLLVGPSGVGKTTVGARLARDLALPFHDSDAAVERRGAATVAELFAARGEAGFRALERAALDELLAGPPAVIAVGAGALAAGFAAERLAAAGTVVHLDAAPATLLQRLGAARDRPLLADDPAARAATIAAQHAARTPGYAACARFSLATDALSPAAVARAILERLPRPAP